MSTSLLLSIAAILVSSSFAQDELDGLAANIPGLPGQDYPIFAVPPETSFVCDGQIRGYYADPEADCQSFHICAENGNDGLNKFSFLCPNGTLFHLQYFICDWWFNVDCSIAEDFYALNEDVAVAQDNANEPRDGRAAAEEYISSAEEARNGLSPAIRGGFSPFRRSNLSQK